MTLHACAADIDATHPDLCLTAAGITTTLAWTLLNSGVALSEFYLLPHNFQCGLLGEPSSSYKLSLLVDGARADNSACPQLQSATTSALRLWTTSTGKLGSDDTVIC